MKRSLIIAALLTLSPLPLIADGKPPSRAVAVLHPTEGHKVNGNVTITQSGKGAELTVTVNGLEPGPHGFHIHEFGDCTAADGSSAGDHYDLRDHPHGAPDSPKRHLGDLGNIVADAGGTARATIRSDSITLGGPGSVLGRSFVVHQKADDFTTQPAGASGERLACGVIGAANG